MISVYPIIPILLSLSAISAVTALSNDAAIEVRSADAKKAMQVAEGAWTRLLDAEAIRFDFTTVVETSTHGMRQEFESRYEIKLQRPNRFAIIAKSGQFAETIVSNGEVVLVFFPATGRYYEDDAPPNIDEFFTENFGGLAGAFSARPFLGPLFSREAFNTARETIRDANYLGRQSRGEAGALHRLRVRMDPGGMSFAAGHAPEEYPPSSSLFKIDVDVAEGPDQDMLIERIHIDMTEFLQANMAYAGEDDAVTATMLREMKMRYTLRFTNWELAADFGPDAFTFAPPKGAEQVPGANDLFGDRTTGAGEQD